MLNPTCCRVKRASYCTRQTKQEAAMKTVALVQTVTKLDGKRCRIHGPHMGA